MHPANLMAAVVKDDEHPWEGGIITSVSGEFENLDKKGHGVKLEPLCLVVRTPSFHECYSQTAY